jgi:hypothetical protein
MPPRRDDDERERLSWREIDQRRDGSRHRAKTPPPAPKAVAEMVRKQALAQAEALFKGKRARPEYQTDLKKLEASHGGKKFALLAKKFLEEYGLPEEWGALTRSWIMTIPGWWQKCSRPWRARRRGAAGWKSRGSRVACKSSA